MILKNLTRLFTKKKVSSYGDFSKEDAQKALADGNNCNIRVSIGKVGDLSAQEK